MLFTKTLAFRGSVYWSWVVGFVGRGSQVVGRGSWFPSRGSRVVGRGLLIEETLVKANLRPNEA